MTLFRRLLSEEEQESDQKKMSFERTDRKKGRISRWVFSSCPTIGTFSPSKTGDFFTGGNISGEKPSFCKGPLNMYLTFFPIYISPFKP